jgi:hypothetical protein
VTSDARRSDGGAPVAERASITNGTSSSSRLFGGTAGSVSACGMSRNSSQSAACRWITTVWRWVQAYAPEIRKRLDGHLKYKLTTWFMDETYVRVSGRWMCLFRAWITAGRRLISICLKPEIVKRPNGTLSRSSTPGTLMTGRSRRTLICSVPGGTMAIERATNLELQKWIARRHGFVVESEWLDSYRRQCLEPGTKSNVSAEIPPDKLVAIRQAFRHFGIPG